jgi:hypothetical protein
MQRRPGAHGAVIALFCATSTHHNDRMRRLAAILALIVALVSVCTPSLAVGSRGFVAHPDALVLLQDDGTYVKAPCPLTGGKRLLHARPDMGVLPALVFLRSPPAQPLLQPAEEIVREAIDAPPLLPPPRQA